MWSSSCLRSGIQPILLPLVRGVIKVVMLIFHRVENLSSSLLFNEGITIADCCTSPSIVCEDHLVPGSPDPSAALCQSGVLGL